MNKFCLLLIFFLLSSLSYACAENSSVIRPRVGLALGGGGARGAAHIGVLRVLERENIPIDNLVGTSAGAFIAALYSGGSSPDNLEKFVDNGVIKKSFATNISVRRALFIHLNRALKTFLGKPFYAGLYNDHKLHHFINNAITKKDGSIEMYIPLHIIAVDLVSGVPVVIKSGDVGLAVQASTAIPALRQPIQIGDKLLVDGGVLRNIPIDEARKMGSDVVIAIDVDSNSDIFMLSDFRSFERTVLRVINLGLMAQSEYLLEKADIVIRPNLKGIDILDFDRENLKRAILAGEEAAMKKIPEIKKRLASKNKY